MNYFICLCFLLVSVFCANTNGAGTVPACNPTAANAAAGVFAHAWQTVLPDSTKETCRVLGWKDAQAKQPGLFDKFVPQVLKAGMGMGFAAAFPAEMQDCFCKQAGMIKDVPTPQPNTGGTQFVFGQPVVVQRPPVVVVPQNPPNYQFRYQK